MIKNKMEAEAIELLGKINEMKEEQSDLTDKLAKSLAIRAVCPDAFKFGPCKSRVKRKPGKDLFESFHVIRGDGSEMVITDRNALHPILRNMTFTETEKRIMKKREFAKRMKERRAMR